MWWQPCVKHPSSKSGARLPGTQPGGRPSPRGQPAGWPSPFQGPKTNLLSSKHLPSFARRMQQGGRQMARACHPVGTVRTKKPSVPFGRRRGRVPSTSPGQHAAVP